MHIVPVSQGIPVTVASIPDSQNTISKMLMQMVLYPVTGFRISGNQLPFSGFRIMGSGHDQMNMAVHHTWKDGKTTKINNMRKWFILIIVPDFRGIDNRNDGFSLNPDGCIFSTRGTGSIDHPFRRDKIRNCHDLLISLHRKYRWGPFDPHLY
jgi:hypothetical protein